MKYSMAIDLIMGTTGIMIFFCYLQLRNYNDKVNYFTAIYIIISLFIAHIIVLYFV